VLLNVETDSLTKVDLNQLLKTQAFDFGSLVREVKFIPLETKDESLVDNILKIVVSNSYVYIYDDFKKGGVIIFTKDGAFVKRISNGNGPGELYQVRDIDFDKNKNELVAYQHPFLMYYSAVGNFLRKKKLPFGFYNFLVTDDGYIFKTIDGQGNEHLGGLKDNTLLITDKDFRLKSVGLPCLPSNVNLAGYRYLYNNTLSVTQAFTDTIYNYNSSRKKIMAKYFIDYKSKEIPKTYLNGTWDEFEKAIRTNDYYFYLGEYLETQSLDVFFLENWFKGLKTVIYRNKKSGNVIGGTNAYSDINEIPPMAYPKAASGDYLISCYLPSKKDSFIIKSSIISFEDKERLKGLTEDDNPVLVFYKLQDF